MNAEINVNLPSHCEKLLRAKSAIDGAKYKFDIIVRAKSITPKSHDALYEQIIRVLDFVGNLSQSVFNVEDQLEQQYFSQYKDNPCLAKQLWLEHYDSLHKPYSLLKNKCYRMLDELDEEFIIVHKRYPPNWNY